ncbi:MAG: ABC transporter ATP-binding protein [Planctomycetota bacterium]|nr:ABC transporter ATP-binding protein [Planctomycetota bacterium]
MGYGLRDLARNLVGAKQDHNQLRADEFWALSDISFDLHKGESLGIIGLNGSGKSTLLRILNGIFPPDDGEVVSRGRIGGLIALGAGMHPHMTGRENIYLNGTILGMTRAEIDAKMEGIIQFAEIGDFLEAPLATYSSGMRVRLGFAVAIHGEPDILLIDEVLAVGDYAFVNKSLRYLHAYRQRAKALLYISHNLEQVRNLCERVIVLDGGRVAFVGGGDEGVAFYQDMSTTRRANQPAPVTGELTGKTNLIIAPSENFRFLDFGIRDADGQVRREIRMNEPLRIFAKFRVLSSPTRLFFSVGVLDERRENVIWLMSNDFHKADFGIVPPGTHELVVTIEEHHLAPGIFYPLVAIRDQDSMETYSRVSPGLTFAVRPAGNVIARGLVHVDERWELFRNLGGDD